MAAGPDNIPAEALKEGYLTKLPKKGDLISCFNYRGITLLSIPGKVFNRVLLNRMKDAIDPQLHEQQAGFRKNRSCTDQIATLHIILEQSLEWNSPLYIKFVDYEKAFDSVDRQTLWKLLRHYRIPEKITYIIQRDDLQGKNWSEARVPAVASYVSSDNGLGNEDIYSPRAKWNPVDTLEAVG